jgi:hypothetical protein
MTTIFIAITALLIALQAANLAAVIWTFKRNRLTFATVHAGIRKSHDDNWELLTSIGEKLQQPTTYFTVEEYSKLLDAYCDACLTLLQAGLLESGNALERDSQTVVET